MARVLILGGTVFVGKHTVQAFQAAGWDVSILNRGKTPGELPEGVERLVADRTQADQLRSALGDRDWDAVVDVSGFVMVAGTVGDAIGPLLDLLEGHTNRYVFVSSIMAYDQVGWMPWSEDGPVRPEPPTTYGGFKVAVETEIRRRFEARAFPACAVRPAAIYGPDNNIFDMETPMFLRLLQHRPVLVPHEGLIACNYGHVDDLCDAVVEMATNDAALGEVFNITAEAVTTQYYVDVLAEIVGVEADVRSVPRSIVDSLPARPPAWGHLFGDRHHGVISIEKARQLLGVEPSYGFRRGHEQTYEWFRNQGWHDLDANLVDPVWSASWDFGHEADIAARVRAG